MQKSTASILLICLSLFFMGCGKMSSSKDVSANSANSQIIIGQGDVVPINNDVPLDFAPYMGEDLAIVAPQDFAETYSKARVAGVCKVGYFLLISGPDVYNARTPACGETGIFDVVVHLTEDLGPKTIEIELKNPDGFTEQTTTVDVTVIETPIEPLPDPIVIPLNGASLYANNCANCHGDLANTMKPGRSANQIMNAIMNVQAMNNINLNTEQIQAIADVLGQ